MSNRFYLTKVKPDESNLPFEEQSLVFRLRRRAEIRRNNIERKSVLENRPDRIANLLEEAADKIENLEGQLLYPDIRSH